MPTRGIPYVLFAAGAGGPEQEDAMRTYLDKVMGGMQPWSDSGRMPNFLAADEAITPEQVSTVYGAQRYQRLAAIKKPTTR